MIPIATSCHPLLLKAQLLSVFFLPQWELRAAWLPPPALPMCCLQEKTGRQVLLYMVLITNLFNPGMIPNFLLVRSLGLINSLWSLILTGLSSGYYILLMKGFYDGFPVELEEAAALDGCNDISVWFRIILPLSRSSLAAFAVFFAVGFWNVYFNAILYINSYKKWPLQVLLQNLLIDSLTGMSSEVAAQMSAEMLIPAQTLKMAAVVIATVPIVIVYPFLQKHFTKGVMVGSIKE